MANPTDDVIIVGQLKDDALRDAVTDLVNFVENQTNSMADHFDRSLQRMQEAMKQLGVSQKVSVTMMKDALQQYGLMFEDIWTKINGGGGPKNPRDPDTLGGLKDELKDAEKMRDTLALWSPEIQHANERIAMLRAELREATKTSEQRSKEIKRELAKEYSVQLSAASIMPDKEIKGAENKLRELLRIKNELRATPVLDDAKMQRLNNQITTTIQRVRELRNAASVPTDVQGVLGMSTKTLDEIALKMQAIRNIRGGFELGSPELQRLNMEYEKLSKLQSEYLGKNTLVEKSNNALARSFSYIRNRIVYAMTLGAATSFTKQIYEIRGQYELLERSLGVLVNSFQKGSEIFQELNEMAIKSPFTLIELGTAAKQLTAYNFATEEVVDTTRRLADISAALGVPMERLTYNLGQIRAQTVLTARDARDFANAGLPIAKALADYYTELEGRVVSTGDVFDRMSKKAVSYNDVMAVLYKMTDEGGKFFNFQEKQADTLRVQINNLTLAWNNMLNEVGKANQGLLTLPVQGMKELLQNWQTLDRIITDLIWVLGSAKVAQLLFNMSLSKGNLEVIRSIALLPQSTAANYQESLSKMNLTKVQAKWLIATNKSNVALRAAIVNMGVLTTRQAAAAASTNVLMGAWTRAWTTLGVVMQGLGKGIGMVFNGLKSLALNPATWVFAASMAITDLIADFNAASDAAKELNDAMGRRTKENSESIEKFTSDYAKSFEKLKAGNLGQDEQVKLWDAIAEEIKKSTQNADQYLAKLQSIHDLAQRDKEGGDILTDVSRIQDAVNAAQERELVEVRETIGIGGMWQHGLVEQLKDFTDELNDATEAAADDFEGFNSKWEKILDVMRNPENYSGGMDWAAQLTGDMKSAQEQMDVLTESISNAMQTLWPKDVEKNSENIREFVTSITNSVKEANPEIKGQMERLFDNMVDNYIAMQVQSFGQVRDKSEILIQGTYSAWEVFFDKMKSVGGKEFEELMNYVVSHGDYSNAKLQEIWNNAAEAMKNEANESYIYIERLVKNLNNMKVIIPVMFQQTQKNLSELQKDFEDTFITAGLGALSYEEYTKKLLENQRTYGKLQQKDGETTLAWNKRLNDLYNDQYANIAQQDKIMKSIGDTSSVIYQQAEKTKKDYEEQMKATEAVAKHEGFALELSKKNKGNTPRGRKDEDIVAEALKQELSLIKDMQSNYEKLRKAGVDNMTAVNMAAQGYEATLEKVNKTLSKYGISKFNAKDFLGKDVNDVLAKLEKQRAELVSSGTAKTSAIEAMDMKIQELRVEAKTYNMKKITDGLNNELGRLKEEYELGVEIDANPELGAMMADMMGLDTSGLPRTVKEYTDEYTRLINKYLGDVGAGMSLPSLDLITNDDLRSLEQMAKDGKLNEEWVKIVSKGVDDIRSKRRKDAEETIKEWNNLLEKYGEYETKIVKVAQQTSQEQLNIIRKFGSSEDQVQAMNLANKITLESSPEDINRIQKQLADLVNKAVEGKTIGVKVATSIDEGDKKRKAKVEWDVFKDSDLYALTFEDMDRVSTRAIRSILDQLDILKDKVKDDPASMKALMDAYKKGRDELESRAPFESIIQALKEWKVASTEAAAAHRELKAADEELKNAEENLKSVQQQNASPNNRDSNQNKQERLAKAQERYTKAVKNKNQAEAKAAQAEIKQINAQTKFKNALNNSASALENMGSLLTQFAELLGIAEDSEAGEMVKSLAQGFTMMATALSMVAAVATIAEMSLAWVAVVAMALTLVVSLVSFLAGQSNRKITAQIEEIDDDIHDLEIAYKNLEYAADRAYGAMVAGARAALKANKEAELADKERQLELAKSRTGKHYDQDEVDNYQKDVVDLRNEIKDLTSSIVEDLLDISSAGDGITDLVDAMVTAFKNGEDAMAAFGEKWDEMIDNMILKLLVTTFMQKAWDNIMKTLEDKENEFMQKASEERANAQKEYDNALDMSDDEIAQMIAEQLGYRDEASRNRRDLEDLVKRGSLGVGSIGMTSYNSTPYFFVKAWQQVTDEEIAAYRKMLEDAVNGSSSAIDKASVDYTQWALDYMNGEGRAYLEGYAELLKNALGDWYTYGQDSQQGLSALQQGIQGITEDTAGALEGYMNNVSQQMYLQSDVILEIRDTLMAFDLDVQVATMSQILLQLQDSYQLLQSMEGLMRNWTNPSGNGIRVELLS